MKKSFICIMLALFCISMGFSVNKNEQADKNTKVVITGYIISKGNMPFPQAAIQTTDGQEYLIICNEKSNKKLLNTQGNKVKLTGYIQNDTGFFVLKKWKKVK
ncbi:MAG: hypothetical protein J5726_06080 [Treponema sp.]|nr:hypothetical protein [Treponema sp.]